MPKMKRATQLTLFSTGLMIAAVFVLYIMVVATTAGVFFRPEHLLLFGATAVAAYVVSALIIDQVLNPIRLMISKIREIGDMDFTRPLTFDDDDDELREYAFQFNNMTRKLNQYIERQKRFVSDASHELATPITIINGHADLLLRHGITGDPALLENGLSTIKNEIMRMNDLVEGLLSLARSDSGQENYTFQATNITSLLEESLAEIKVIAPHFTFELNSPKNLTARCDEYAILRVMRIILSNSIRYAETGKYVEITATESHGFVNVNVKDNGIGIPSEHLSKVFRRFYRVDTSRSKKTGSSGLGLAIAKEIITSHGGNIEARSKPGEGTEILFRVSASTPSRPNS